jgi:DHA3 family macrolide efflux protein-like MFS transporter
MQQDTSSPNPSAWLGRTVRFLSGQSISLLGSSLVQYAIIWHIARETDSGLIMALATVFSFLPQLFVSLFAGVWADRYNRKMLIIFADAGIALFTLVLALMMSAGRQSMVAMVAVMAVRSLGGGIQTPAVNALIPQIVPEEKLMRVNSISGSVQSIVNLVAPAIGGAVLSMAPLHYVLFIDVITAVIGIAITITVKVPRMAPRLSKEKVGYFDDLKAGLRYAFGDKFLRGMLIVYCVACIMIAVPAMLNVLYVTRIYGDSYLYLTLNETAFFVGAILGGVALSAWGGFKNRLSTLALGCLVFGVFTVGMGLAPAFAIYLALMLIIGISMPMVNTPAIVLLQEVVEPQMHGRVFSLVSMASSISMPVGLLIFGPLSDVIPMQYLMIFSGVMLTALSLFVYKVRGTVPSTLPGAAAPAESNA